MATGSDVRDILELGDGQDQEFITKDALFSDAKKKKPKKTDAQFKRPDGMHRELWGLIWSDNKDAPPMMPTDTNHHGYKQMKAKIGQSRVRPWKWMPFTNPARKDGTIFHHWRRVADEGKEYPFARFNKQVDMPVYSDLEYQQNLHDESWSRQETDYLFDMAKRFDLRFVIMHDRWDTEKYPKRSVEDLKERFYNIKNLLTKFRAPPGSDPKIRAYDADHERRRKDQLNKLFHRTQEQIEEEDYLLTELKKIEQRKKEREKKTQDLQKLITAADCNADARRSDRKSTKKKLPQQQKLVERNINPETTGIKFADFKASGVTLRSQRMKLPASVGQKKSKAIEQVLEELGLENNPIPTEEVVSNFNELRQDIVLLYELKLAAANCEYELQTLRHRFETLAPGKVNTLKMAELGPIASTTSVLKSVPSAPSVLGAITIKEEIPSPKKISEAIDIVGTPGTPGLDGEVKKQKRKAALEQSNVLKKLKQKM